MKKLTPFLLAGVLILGVGCQNQETPESPTETSVETSETGEALGTNESAGQLVAEVGDRVITRDYFNKNVALQTYGFEQLRNEEGEFNPETQAQLEQIREMLLDDMVDLNVVMILAEEAGLSVSDEELEEVVTNYLSKTIEEGVESPSETSLSIRQYFEDNNITEENIRSILHEQLLFQKYLEYIEEDYFSNEENMAELEDNFVVEVKASHILVEDKEKADEIYAQATPENFAELATEYSNDPGSKDQGGDLGYFKPGMMIQEFSDKAFETPVGTIAEPVKTDYGYHIIYVTDAKTMADIRSTEEPDAIQQAETTMKQSLLSEEYFKIINKAKESIQVNTYPVN